LFRLGWEQRKSLADPLQHLPVALGSGMENHSKYVEQIYSHGDDALYINLFIPSIVDWKEKGIVMKQETSFPESDTVRLTYLGNKTQVINFNLRKPYWATGNTYVQLKGAKPPNLSDFENSFSPQFMNHRYFQFELKIEER
jgi:DUF1680 family protein